uniref:Uncharacterized protein n=1 Tax=Glossina austeni TaxID=7395 RepID=A0A1A9VSP1_GLOAU
MSFVCDFQYKYIDFYLTLDSLGGPFCGLVGVTISSRCKVNNSIVKFSLRGSGLHLPSLTFTIPVRICSCSQNICGKGDFLSLIQRMVRQTSASYDYQRREWPQTRTMSIDDKPKRSRCLLGVLGLGDVTGTCLVQTGTCYVFRHNTWRLYTCGAVKETVPPLSWNVLSPTVYLQHFDPSDQRRFQSLLPVTSATYNLKQKYSIENIMHE